jgi:hypothetical protein
MTIEIPDDFQARFDRFDHAEQLLISRFSNGGGVSRQNICQVFGAASVTSSMMRDPAFLVWAGMRGVTKAEDFFPRWDKLAAE